MEKKEKSERQLIEEGILASARSLKELTVEWYTEQWHELEDIEGEVYFWRVSKLPDHLRFSGYNTFTNDKRLIVVTMQSESNCLVLDRWRIDDPDGPPGHDSYYIINLFGNGSIIDKGGKVADNPRLVELGVSELSLAEVEGVLGDFVKAISNN